METQVVIDKSTGSAFLPAIAAAVSTNVRPVAPSNPVIKETTGGLIHFWGDSNTFPQDIYKKASNTFIPSVIDWQVRALVSRLIYGVEQIDEATGKTTFIRKSIPEINQWLKRTNIFRYLTESASDLYWFGNFFPEIILSNDRKSIAAISAQEASYCRWGKEMNGSVAKTCYVNANWDNGGTPEDNYSIPVPTIDPYYDSAESLRGISSGFKFIYPMSFPSPGKTFYQVAAWDSVRKNGWLDIAISIPVWKKSLMTNQISLKYHIKVPDNYWAWKYKDWDVKTDEDRIKLVKDELKAFNDFAVGEKKAGNSFMTVYKVSEDGKEGPSWSIEPIDDKLKDGTYIEDSKEATAHILFNMGIDGTLIGNAPGSGMGAGSGSDKRVAFNQYMLLRQLDEQLILEPLNNLIIPYNGWDENLEFRFKRDEITTLNYGVETKPVE